MPSPVPLPDEWLTGVWIPVFGIAASVFVGIVAICIALRSARLERVHAGYLSRVAFSQQLARGMMLFPPALFRLSDLNAPSALLRDAEAVGFGAPAMVEWLYGEVRRLTTRELEVRPDDSDLVGVPSETINAFRHEFDRRLDLWAKSELFDVTPWNFPPPSAP